MSAALDELRARTPLPALIGQRVPLRREGRLWKACCPFHNEKTASFVVYPDHFHCFGCGAHGDAITWIKRTEGGSFDEAAARLAAEAGMDAPMRTRGRGLSTGRYAARLLAESRPIGELGRRYLREHRGIEGELPNELREHPAVWCRETRSTHPALLLPAYDGDRLGRLQAVLLDPATAAKANVLTPKLTFGGGAAHVPVELAARTPGGPVLLCEGPEDAIALWSVTGHRTLASLGAGSLGKPKLPAGARLVIFGDNGETGRAQAHKAAEAHRARGCHVVVAFPPDGIGDANDLLRFQGPEGLHRCIRAALLEAKGLAPADPPFPLPNGTLAQAHADVARIVGEFYRAKPGLAAPQILLTGEGGIGKTDAVTRLLAEAMLVAKRENRAHRLVFMLPEHVTLGPQIEARFRALGLHVATLRGRGDPFAPPNPSKPPLCGNLAAVREARRVGASPSETVCRKGAETCSLYAGCGYIAAVAAAAAADVVIAASSYLFEPLPKAVRENVGWIVVDEQFADRGDSIRNLTVESFAQPALDRFPVLTKGESHDGWTRRLGWLNDMLHQACAASPDGYLAADALRTAGLTPDQADEAHKLSWRRKVAVEMTPAMELEERRAAAQRAAINAALPTVGAAWLAVAAILRDGKAAAGRLKLSTRDGRNGSVRELVVHGQRRIAEWLDELPVLMLNATGGIEDARRFFPRAVERTPVRVATPHAHTRLILGGFGKSTLARHPRKLADLRAYLAVEHASDELGIVTHLSAVGAFDGMTHTHRAHHGASAGDDTFRDVSAMAVIGGMSAPPDVVAALAAARTGQAVPIERAVPATASVLMTDGTGVAVPALAYTHPAAQAVHAAILNASINQAAARPRQVMRTAVNPVTITIFGNIAPNVPIAEIVHWRDIRPDRLVHMVARRRVFLNAADMTRHHPDLFRTEKAAASARARFGDVAGRLRDLLGRDRRGWSRVRFQPAGQGQQLRWAWCPTAELDALRAEIEAVTGEVTHWQPETFSESREDIPTREIRPLTGVGMSSPINVREPSAWRSVVTVEPAARPPDG